jgi:hypothetical protein
MAADAALAASRAEAMRLALDSQRQTGRVSARSADDALAFEGADLNPPSFARCPGSLSA